MTTKVWLGENAKFSDVFPQVAALTLNVEHKGDLPNVRFIPLETVGMQHFTESTIPGLIHCKNPRCQQGGYKFQLWITEMVRTGKTLDEGTWHCEGHEGTPSGRRVGDLCGNYLEWKLTIRYTNGVIN